MGAFNVQIRIGDAQAQEFETVEALVDTGATYTVLPNSLLARLRVQPHTRADFVLADGRRRELAIGRTWIELDGRREFSLVVFGDEGTEPILGAVTLEEFRLAPDPVARQLIPVPGLLMAIARRHSTHSTAPERERAFLVAVESRGSKQGLSAEASLDELALLVSTAGGEVVGRAVQRLETPNVAHYVGKGKLEEIVAEREVAGYTMVVFDDELSPSQQRNLEDALKVKVLDRTALIIDIFARRAQTREARLQVELAQSQYLLPRLAGQWSHLERLSSGSGPGAGRIGVRGPGETQIETDRRLVRNRITRLRREIEDVRRQRSLHRTRRARQGLPVVALVGYTNAGKSTLMRALSGADVLTEDLLFATLDPVTRRIRLPSGEPALLSDTVGFIQKLPTELVAAFRATLEELADADVLVHLVDITHPDAEDQFETVERTLSDLGLADKQTVVAFNKIDLIAPTESVEDAIEDVEGGLRLEHPQAVLISAAKRWHLDGLLAVIERELEAASASRGLTSA